VILLFCALPLQPVAKSNIANNQYNLLFNEKFRTSPLPLTLQRKFVTFALLQTHEGFSQETVVFVGG